MITPNNAIYTPGADAAPQLNSHSALMKQKDHLIKMIDTATDGKDLLACIALLEYSHELWAALAYEYKAKELFARIQARAARLQIEEEDFLAAERKNYSGRGFCESNIARLQKIRDRISL